MKLTLPVFAWSLVLAAAPLSNSHTLLRHQEQTGRFVMGKKASEYALKLLDPNAPKHAGDYSIRSFQLIYETTNPRGEKVEASALVVLRSDLFENHQKPRSWVHYSHGARFESETSPSTLAYDPEALAARLFLAREGHLVFLPDYLGLGVNSSELQSYLNARQQAADSWDALLALRQWSEEIGLPLSDQLFLAGYSQGGFVTLALQRKMQKEKLSVGPKLTASFPMAGPYTFSGFSEEQLLENAHPQLYGFIAFMIISLSQDPRYNIDLHALIAPEHHPVLDQVLNKEISLLEFTKIAAKARYDFYASDFLDTITDKDHPIYKAVHAQTLTEDWIPEIPTVFMAAKDDEVIPFKVTEKTYQRFNERGAPHIEFIELPSGLGHVDAIHPGFINLRQQIERFLGNREITKTPPPPKSEAPASGPTADSHQPQDKVEGRYTPPQIPKSNPEKFTPPRLPLPKPKDDFEPIPFYPLDPK